MPYQILCNGTEQKSPEARSGLGVAPSRCTSLHKIRCGIEAVVPAVIQVLLDGGQQVLYWGEAVNGMCAMMASAGASRDLALRCGPVIAYLFSQESLASDRDFDFGYLLDVLKKS
jgi:hypothetical protein